MTNSESMLAIIGSGNIGSGLGQLPDPRFIETPEVTVHIIDAARRSRDRASSGCWDIFRLTSRPEIANELSFSSTPSALTSVTSRPNSRSVTGPRPCGARELRLLSAARTRSPGGHLVGDAVSPART